MNLATTLRKTAAIALGACACISAHAQYTPYFSMTGITWEDETTFRLDGARILGLGLSTTDEVSLRYQFRPGDATFGLIGAQANPGAGVVFLEQNFTSLEAQPAVVSYTANGTSYAGNSSSRSFTATAAAPFVATASLQPGHVISLGISRASADWRYEMIDPEGKVLHAFDSLAGASVISNAFRITRAGVHTVRIIPRSGSGTLSFDLEVFNGNNKPMQQLTNGARISTSFENNIRHYYKGVVQLQAGSRLSLSQASSDIGICVLDELSRKQECSTGLPVSTRVTRAGNYYVFIYNIKGWGGSYSGTVSVTQEQAAQVTTDGRVTHADSARPAPTSAGVGAFNSNSAP